MEQQMSADALSFHIALVQMLAVRKKLTRQGFYNLVKDAYDYLPVRGGGDFWKNICKLYEVKIVYKDCDEYLFDEGTIRRLSDAIWLPIDQELKTEKQCNEIFYKEQGLLDI
jgi:hypothetical protein